MCVPKWILIAWPKIPQMPQNLSVQFVCPSPKVLDINEKKASSGVRSPWVKSKKVGRMMYYVLVKVKFFEVL